MIARFTITAFVLAMIVSSGYSALTQRRKRDGKLPRRNRG